MPDPIPVMVLGRLAVDLAHQQQGLGQALLRDAILRTIQAADIAGIRALLVHAIDEQAGQFYAKFGFSLSPTGQQIWMLQLQDARISVLGSS
jgi:predicted N-acetyltransferase YhbS